jgi:vancomycin resistance protein YoaR
VPGIGGGVSQVTGNLFNAALLAGLPIQEYRAHSKPVLYLPPGRDATLAWNAIDLKFKNTTGAPLSIACQISGNRLTTTLYGKRSAPGRRIVLKVQSQKPEKDRLITVLYRTVKQKGKVLRKERIGRSEYTLQPENAD